jgi:proteasome lid subunit RPN8/RPN11
VKITTDALEQVRAHAAQGYPYEICGVLIGTEGSGIISQIRRVHNTVVERARDRYEMDPVDQIRIQRECDRDGLEILGYYHSHPDHPARASITDSERSWAGALYLIVSCIAGEIGEINAFVAERDGGPMRLEPLEISAANRPVPK